MSRVFNNTTDQNGLVQMFEEEIGAKRGYVSGNTDRLKSFASATRSAWDTYLYLAIKSSGTWQFDDSNHTDYPIIKTDIVANKQDYTFVSDENGNLILDIFKVALLPSATATEYVEIEPIDQQDKDHGEVLVSETSVSGIPYQYDKTANGIFLSPKPSYSVEDGLKVYINREASYFTYTDTTKKAGCAGIHHDYFFIRPAMEYARRNGLDSYNRLREEVIGYEGDEEKGIIGSIERYFTRRTRDEQPFMRPALIDSE